LNSRRWRIAEVRRVYEQAGAGRDRESLGFAVAVVLEPEISQLRKCDGSLWENRANLRVAAPGAVSTWTLKLLATIGTFGESCSLAEFPLEPNELVPEAVRLTSQLVQLGNSLELPARNHVALTEFADELPSITFPATFAEPARARTNAAVAVTLA